MTKRYMKRCLALLIIRKFANHSQNGKLPHICWDGHYQNRNYHTILYLKEVKTLTQKDIYTPLFVATLFTIAKTQKQPKCPQTDEEYTVYIHSGILLSHKREENLAICNNMFEPRGHYIVSEITQTEKDKYHVISLLCGI